MASSFERRTTQRNAISGATRRDGANFAPTGVVLTSSSGATLRFVRLGGHEIGDRQRLLGKS